jgi:hypothetical protein
MSIRRFYERLGIFVEGHGRLIIVCAILLFIFSLLMAQQIEFATGTDTFVDKDSRIYQDYQHLYLENFRTDSLVVMVSSDDVTSPEVLEAMDSLENYIREVEHVISVSSITDYAKQMNVQRSGISEIGNRQTYKRVLSQFYGTPLLPNKNNAFIFIEIESDLTTDQQEEILNQIQQRIDFMDLPPSTTMVLTGETAFNLELQGEMSKTLGTTMAIAALLMVVILTLVFRYVRWYFLPFIIIIIALIYTFGLMGFLDIKMTMVSMAIFPILLGLGLDYAIQFHNRIEEELKRREDRKEAVYYTVGRTGPAVAIALTITAFGFSALLTSPVPMIRGFAMMGIVGIVVCYLTALFVGVFIIYELDRRWIKKHGINRENKRNKKVSRVDNKVSKVKISDITMWTAKRPFAILSIALLLGGIGFYYDEKVDVQTDVREYVPPDLDCLLEFKKMESLMGGRTDYMVVLVRGDIDSETQRWMEDFGKHEVELNPHIHSYHTASAEGNTLAAIYLDIGDAYAELGLSGTKELSQQIYDDLQWLPPPPGITATLTGDMYLFTIVLDALTSGRVEMTVFGLFLIFLALLVIYRNLKKALVPVIPMIIVTGWSGGLMYFAGVPYTPLTATLGALILGIGGEYTVLMMERYYEERENGLDPYEAMKEATTKIGRAILASGLTVLFGFSALITSSFPMQSNFGLVTVMDMTFVILATFLIFPPLIVTLDRLGEFRGRHILKSKF